MLSDHPKMLEYRRARRVLAQADDDRYPEGVVSYDEYSSGPNKESSSICYAVHTWLESRLQGDTEGNSTVIVSCLRIPSPRACMERLNISASFGPKILAEMSAKPKTRGAPGGKNPHLDTQELPEVRKKGPYTWNVDVQVTSYLR